MKYVRARRVLCAAGVTALLAIACGSNRDPVTGGNNLADGGAFGDANGGGIVSPTSACANLTTPAQLRPLDIYIMLDQSNSMNEGSKWSSVTTALKTFLQQPSLEGVGVGIQYFGIAPKVVCPPTCQKDSDCGNYGPCVPGFAICAGCAGDSCNVGDYSTPEVEIAPLPGAASAVIDSINKHGPSTGTPTAPALQGAVNHAKAWAVAHPSDVTIALLATDGEPSGCDEDLNHINQIAANGVAGNPKVLTFVIGVGSSLTSLNGIALAGGTGSAYIVDTGANVTQQFLDALNKIRGLATNCGYQIPPPPKGSTIDFHQINVQYTPTGGAGVIIPNVSGKDQCPPTGDAWYYDNNDAPTQVLLCDSSCKTVSGDASGQMSIIVGCGTVVK